MAIVLNAKMLPAVLSVIAGSVDAISFLGLGGLFTAHVTGNLVVLVAHLATGSRAPVANILSVPVFVAVLGLTRLLADVLEKIGLVSLRPLLLVQLLFLVVFLAYPLGLGIWMSFTDARIGRSGAFVGIENYEWLWGDDAFIGATVFTITYTVVASAFKFAIGLYLALLLNKHIPFRALVRVAARSPPHPRPVARRACARPRRG